MGRLLVRERVRSARGGKSMHFRPRRRLDRPRRWCRRLRAPERIVFVIPVVVILPMRRLRTTQMKVPMIKANYFARPVPVLRPRRTDARRRALWSPVANVTVHPLLALPIPGAAVIVASPIGIDRERHDRYAKTRGIRVQRHITTFIGIGDVGRIHPTTGILGNHVAPTPIVETAHDLDG